MDKTAEQIYESIANSLANEVKAPWSEIKVIAEVEDQSIEFKATYINKDTGVPKTFAVGYQTFLDFEKLHQMMKEGPSRWTSAQFRFTEDGKFDIEFGR